MTKTLEIRGHHLEEVASDLRSGRRNATLEILEESPNAQITVTDGYDDFCINVCGKACDDREANLPAWDRAFVNLYGLPLNTPITSGEFLNGVGRVARARSRFATSDLLIGEEEVRMSYDEVLSYLSSMYFNEN